MKNYIDVTDVTNAKIEYFERALKLMQLHQSDLVYDLEIIDKLKYSEFAIFAIRTHGTQKINCLEYLEAVLNNFSVLKYIMVKNHGTHYSINNETEAKIREILKKMEG